MICSKFISRVDHPIKNAPANLGNFRPCLSSTTIILNWPIPWLARGSDISRVYDDIDINLYVLYISARNTGQNVHRPSDRRARITITVSLPAKPHSRGSHSPSGR
jgi:hypothetical protein